MNTQEKNKLLIKQITYRIPYMERPILDQVSFTLDPGDFLVILGSNGSGKSSLIRCLNGTQPLNGGQVALGTKLLTKRSVEKISTFVATLGQDIALSTFGTLTVAENCRIAGAALDCETYNLLRQCHHELPNKLETPANQLSGGQRQCLALALCLLRKPKVLLLDEHTSALDPKIAKKVMEITGELGTVQKNLIILMTTHSLDDALRYGNKLMVMRRGCMIFEAANEKKAQLTKEELLNYYE